MNSGNREGEGQDPGRGEPGAGWPQDPGRGNQQGGNQQGGGQQGGGQQGGGQQGGGQQGGGGQGGGQQWQSGGRDIQPQSGGPRGLDPSFYDVRRPLKFFVTELGLDDAQTLVVTRVLDQLRCEQALSAVEEWRCNSALSDAFAGETLNRSRLDDANATAVHSAERMREVRIAAAEQLFAVLDADQRQKLAYAIRLRLITL